MCGNITVSTSTRICIAITRAEPGLEMFGKSLLMQLQSFRTLVYTVFDSLRNRPIGSQW